MLDPVPQVQKLSFSIDRNWRDHRDAAETLPSETAALFSCSPTRMPSMRIKIALCAYSQTQPRLTSLNPTKVMELIHELSDLRVALAPQVATSMPAGQRLFVTPEPIWEVSGEVRADGKVLLIRHPGLGWLGFIIPHDDCERLAEKLTA
jgi:hypothetical protein